MADQRGPVVPKAEAVSEPQYQGALILGLARVAAQIGRGELADRSARTTRALDKLFSGDSRDTSGKGLLDFLLADPTALDEVLALYGYGLHRLDSDASCDFAAIAEAAALQAEHTEAMRDGHRNHTETLRIADKARPVVKRYAAIIADADRLRGVN